MTRARSGKTVLRGRKRLRKLTKGFRAGRHHLFRQAVVTLLRARSYAYRDRKAKKREFRKLWILRINAAAHQHEMTYSALMHGLKKAGIEIDRKILSDIAIQDAETFAELAGKAKSALSAA